MTIFDDQTLSRSIGASCLLHGTVLALLLIGWRMTPTPQPALQPIPVTLVRTDDTASATIAIPAAKAADTAPAQAQIPTPSSAEASPPPARRATHPSRPPPAAPRATAAAKPAPRDAVPAPKPSDEITALIGEGVDGKPLDSAGTSRSDTGIRSSAPVSDDYLIRLASWLARFQSYPRDAAAKHEQGKDIIGFTVARDGTVQRIWVDRSSGVQALDDASVRMIRSASPVPALPSDLSGATVDFFFPVNYTLSTYQRLFQ